MSNLPGARASPRRKPVATLATLFEAVEAERDNLGRATSVLGCLASALEHHDNPHSGPYFPDVAEIALKMVADSMDKLGIAMDGIDLPKKRRSKQPVTPSIEEGSQSSTDNDNTRDL